ncbi:diiron oxygenase [Actinomadura sp. 3N508]|uniref:diiron oxygenase n=1 Tax=Actinomadura sp. 3N508 TaxID=3375153 RepID=UPI00379E3506
MTAPMGSECRLFPEHLIPYAGHEAIQALSKDARNALMARHLYQYLNFTTLLELNVVNPVAAMIAENRLPVPMKDDARLDAYRIYCDEAYHALCTFDAVRQLATITRVPDPGYDFTTIRRQLEFANPANDSGFRELVKVLQVVVFETVLTNMMHDIPQDPQIHPFVREIVRDHAYDESAHHAYFAKFFRELWTNLDTSARTEAAARLPRIITACLYPNLTPILASLKLCGLNDATARAVIEEVYSIEAIQESTRHAARHTLKLAESIGVLETSSARDGFALEGLIKS